MTGEFPEIRKIREFWILDATLWSLVHVFAHIPVARKEMNSGKIPKNIRIAFAGDCGRELLPTSLPPVGATEWQNKCEYFPSFIFPNACLTGSGDTRNSNGSALGGSHALNYLNVYENIKISVVLGRVEILSRIDVNRTRIAPHTLATHMHAAHSRHSHAREIRSVGWNEKKKTIYAKPYVGYWHPQYHSPRSSGMARNSWQSLFVMPEMCSHSPPGPRVSECVVFVQTYTFAIYMIHEIAAVCAGFSRPPSLAQTIFPEFCLSYHRCPALSGEMSTVSVQHADSPLYLLFHAVISMPFDFNHCKGRDKNGE